MTEKQAREQNCYCRTRSSRFGGDDVAFEVGGFKDGTSDQLCYGCKIDEVSLDLLKEFAKLHLDKYETVAEFKKRRLQL